jgi:hypothetical protein
VEWRESQIESIVDALAVIGGGSVLWRDEAVKTGLIIASNWRRQR